ncbi:MAG: KH domain-containing protein [bacterium]|nr:KH domain-containing protein [bacterium]
MPKNPQQASGLVEMLVRSLVDDQDSVSVVTKEEHSGIVIEVTVAQEETGKVIGRQGRIIKAIRTLARATTDDSVEVEVLG